VQAAWRELEALVAEGSVRSLGLQDASIEALGDVMGCGRVLPVVHSLEVHPGHRNDALLAFCRSQARPARMLPLHLWSQ
jgi:diketogulonate reductase-like aldo/keto reductase